MRRKINLSDKDSEKLQSLYLPSAVTKYRAKQTDLPSLEKELSNHRPGFSPIQSRHLKSSSVCCVFWVLYCTGQAHDVVSQDSQLVGVSHFSSASMVRFKFNQGL